MSWPRGVPTLMALQENLLWGAPKLTHGPWLLHIPESPQQGHQACLSGCPEQCWAPRLTRPRPPRLKQTPYGSGLAAGPPPPASRPLSQSRLRGNPGAPGKYSHFLPPPSQAPPPVSLLQRNHPGICVPGRSRLSTAWCEWINLEEEGGEKNMNFRV